MCWRITAQTWRSAGRSAALGDEVQVRRQVGPQRVATGIDSHYARSHISGAVPREQPHHCLIDGFLGLEVVEDGADYEGTRPDH